MKQENPFIAFVIQDQVVPRKSYIDEGRFDCDLDSISEVRNYIQLKHRFNRVKRV